MISTLLQNKPKFKKKNDTKTKWFYENLIQTYTSWYYLKKTKDKTFVKFWI